ncbi:MAG: DUF4230 domain-containing protein [Spirochaetes bacterium]|nr:DUF4230 domain-containing protein [Spirochaetota bacterium]
MKNLIVKIAIIAALALLGYKLITNTLEFGFNAVSNAVKPTVSIEQRIFNALGTIKEESKLVVQSTELIINQELTSKKRFMWDYYNLGTTKVRMIVPGNKVQYYIPTELLNEETVRWDKYKHKLILNLPDPVLDESLVEVQSDPSKYIIDKEIGWARSKYYSGAYLEDLFRKNLRNYVINMGKEEYYMEKARKNAERVVRELLMNIIVEEKNLAMVKY